MDYNFRAIEKKWQKHWKDSKIYEVENDSDKPKSYVLDMFPYPSGAGLHVGHPLGYIASDVYARYKRLKGFNVLHPMGFDAFGLPAEQYAIETGQHPAATTEKNIATFKKQMDNIGFCFDWSREVRTSDPHYYHWTQWIFLKLFHSWYNRIEKKAQSIETLTQIFEKEGNKSHVCPGNERLAFTAEEWKAFDEKGQQDILMHYRLAYSGVGEVNWCEALGTVLANDEVVNGVSERGGHPVVKKKLRQWYLRITEYADRLLEGLLKVDFSEAMKEMQRNWIGRSEGVEVRFPLSNSPRRGENTILSARESAHSQQRKEKHQGAGYPEYKVTSTKNIENAKENRKHPTEAEAVLWEALRNRSTGYKFRRQHPVENYIVDFACLHSWLVVEVDGRYHATEEQQDADDKRTKDLNKLGFSVLRFTNEDILHNLDNVINKIKNKCIELESRLSDNKKPSPKSEGWVRVYTTRPDTIFGVDFMVLAPEHELIDEIKTKEQAIEVDEYVAYTKSRSERERIAEKKITGCFTGSYAIHPFTGKEIPIWISEYVLAGYGTGAVMAVPCGDERDLRFAKHFNIPVTNIIGNDFDGENANPTKEAMLENSDFLNGMKMKDAISVITDKIEEKGWGRRKVNFKMRDASFSRQRYWGEPFPIKWENGIAYPLEEKDLPLELPHVDTYAAGPEGEGPLANIPEWTKQHLETNTMPGYAGSSWYFLRYMDPHNHQEFASKRATDYWNQVDVYIGGTEHAVGHLLYSRLWTKVLYDLGYIGFEEPFKKLINQGKITGESQKIYRYIGLDKKNFDKVSQNQLPGLYGNTMVSFNEAYPLYYSAEVIKEEDLDNFSIINVPIQFVDNNILNIDGLRKLWKDDRDGVFVTSQGYYLKGQWYNFDKEEIDPQAFSTLTVVEKMSKSKSNVVNPDAVVEEYGADTFRMYEMFLGPIEQSKPWDTKGIEGVSRFLKKLWRLFYDAEGCLVTKEAATEEELKTLHKTIKKVAEDSENFSFNTAVSQFMICVNELTALKCHKKEILEPLVITLASYAPHVAEELWHRLGHEDSILDASFPDYEEKYLKESSVKYPVAINGKTRTKMSFDPEARKEAVEKEVLANDVVQKWIDGKPVRKFILVKGRMINVVV